MKSSSTNIINKNDLIQPVVCKKATLKHLTKFAANSCNGVLFMKKYPGTENVLHENMKFKKWECISKNKAKSYIK